MKVVARIIFLLTLCMPLMLPAQNKSGQEAAKISKIVIDPGHGGKDPGCVYGGFLEKDLNLSVSLKFGELIKKNFPDVEVIYTRTTDKYLGLAERSAVANNAKADLFVSVHTNANTSSSVNGTSTYIMGVDNSAANLAVAMKENDVIVYEDDYSTKYEGFIPGDPTSYIMFSLMQSANRDQSMRMAESMQKHYAHDLPMKDLGARQASFIVLWKCSMPAVLTEIGFLSNEKDRKYITTAKGQNEIARSMFNSFSEYKSKTEGLSSVVLLKERTSLSEPVEQKAPVSTQAAQPAAQTKPATTQQPKPAQTTSSSNDPQRKPIEFKPAPSSPAKSGVQYYIQLIALSKPQSVNNRDIFKSYSGKVVEKRAPNGMYRYLVGSYSTYEEAVRALNTVRREHGSAFVIAYDGDKQISLDEARRRTGR